MADDDGFDLLRGRLAHAPVVAVLVIDDPEVAVPLARALLEGGIGTIELTLRTPAAWDALDRITREVPEMVVGVGTLLTVQQVGESRRRGAVFGVAPGMNPRVIEAARTAGLPFAPGIATPSEIEAAYERGCRVLKFFPAEPSGGVPYLKSIHAPYGHLGLSFIPLGGMSLGNLRSYLECPEVLAVGGSWLATRELIRARDWATITRNGAEAIAVAREVRG